MVQATVRATLVIAFALSFAAASARSCTANDTVFFVVRHAEKAAESGDPPLSDAGAQRAQELMQTLDHLRIDAAYHTNTLRAKQTALPLAERRHIALVSYTNPSSQWLDTLLAEQKGKRTLIVGHSNTVSEIVSHLSGQTIPSIGDHYDNLFVVVISSGHKSVVRLKFGASN